ncbi:hypothetical protein P280DRAFT_450838 [Massarina eburnea CBS 473.64]|uniref:Rhodopsin domain-containing protein n=1 Tax=Massarina eburnea CBS 473.64 TaxID=1395130 RepID=A0A6A6S466_9PLEO|nr:hypothetical protein P280DRAFT_450838 [Massarina eburnea CBS 473.64]
MIKNQNPFQKEAWSEYGVGMVILVTRITYRYTQLGLKWNGDDYFAVLAVIFFTVELVMLELIGQNASITGLSNETALALSPEQSINIVYGSKCLLAGWIVYTTLIWCLKACMLFFYKRLTINLQQQRLVRITGGVCVVAYVVTIIVFLTHCHPLHRLWQVYPYPGDDCALNISKYLVLAVTNVTTDLMIFYIPLPLLWHVQIPLHNKIIYGLWLCTGIFIMTATLLRVIICLGDVSQINVGTIWSIRETFVGIIAVNFPVLKPLLSKATSKLSTAAKGSSAHTGSQALPDSLRLSHVDRFGKKRTVHEITAADITAADNSSEEGIVTQVDEGRASTTGSWMTRGDSRGREVGGLEGITVTNDFDVERGVRT